MPNYQNAKIYMLEPKCEYDDGDIYYGATTQTLARRLTQHKNKMTCKSKLLFEKYGRDNVKIVLVKAFPCNNISELDAEEATFIRGNKCVNKCVPTGIIAVNNSDYKTQYLKTYKHTDAYKEYHRQYKQSDVYKEYTQTDAYKEYHRQYDQTDARKESRRRYEQTDARKEYKRQYNERRRNKRSQSV